MVELLPVAVLMGGLLGLGALANHQELIALRAAGLSSLAIAGPVVLLLLGTIAAIVLLQFYAIPNAERSAITVAARALDQAQVSNEGAFWTRGDNQFLRVNRLANGRTPEDIEIFALSEAGQLETIIRAERASTVGIDEWIMQDVVITTLGAEEAQEQSKQEYRWKSFVDEKSLATLILPAAALTPLALWSYVRELELAQLSSLQYRVMLWQQISRPIGVLAMGLLALGFVQGSMRSLSIGTRLLIGTVIGIAFYLLEQSSSHLAVLYELNPVVSALLPECVLLVLAITALVRSR